MTEKPRNAESRAYGVVLGAIVVAALAIRLAGAFHDWPFSYYGDEMHLTKRAMAMGAGDLNPHWFHKPALLMYLLLGSYGAFFAVGRVIGNFGSASAFGAYYLAEPGPFVVLGRLVVLAFGVATVVCAARLGRRVGGALAGLAAAFAVAVLLPATVGSQVIKEDVPAGFFVAAAALAYLNGAGTRRLAPIVWAGALAGASMGTKYYGIILIPGIVAVELLDVLAKRSTWRALVGRSCVLVGVFVAAFFVTSPYNFLDPTWGQSVAQRLGFFGAHVKAAPRFDPDAKVTYQPGLAAIPGASLHFLRQVVDPEALTAPLVALAALGLIRLLGKPETRRDAVVLASPVIVFWAGAVTLAPYHVQARQLNALTPLLCALIGPGAMLIASLARLRGRVAATVAGLAVVVACVPTLAASIANVRDITRVDSRNVAREWILGNVPHTDRLLLDDYGPILCPNATSIARLQKRLAELPKDEAFTSAQAKRLDLLLRFPPRAAFDLVELGHPWWLPKEISDEELRGSFENRDMGNPLVDRVPKDVAAYRADGVVWVVTNSEAQERYFASPDMADAFPSWYRFYTELRARKPVQTFDPLTWRGKGPTVWIYDLREG